MSWRSNGFPLGPTYANVILYHFEILWLEICPSNFKPIFTDNLFTIYFHYFNQRGTLRNLTILQKKQPKNIKFTSEIEENG